MKFKNARWSIGIFIVTIFVVSSIGIKTHMDNKEDEKLDYQRNAARQIKETVSGLEQIKFDQDGGHFSKTENDFSTWYVDVKLKISNKWYEITTGKEGGFYGGIDKDFPEEKIGGVIKSSVKIVYSNGKEEILE